MSEQEQAQAAAESVETKQDNTETAETEEKGILEEAMGEGAEETTEEAPAEEAAKEEETPAEKPKEVPESYDLKAPEGSELGEDDLKRLAETAKERGYTQEQAEQLVKDEVSFASRQMENFTATTKQWQEDAKADPDIGGKNFQRTLKRGDAVLKEFASREFAEMLKDSGMLYNKELLKMLDKIGAARENDSALPMVARAAAKPQKPSVTGAQKLFKNTPNMNP